MNYDENFIWMGKTKFPFFMERSLVWNLDQNCKYIRGSK